MPIKTAHIELLSPLNVLIRTFSEGRQPGETYDISIVGQMRDPHTCELKGLDKPMRPSDWRAVRTALSEYGVRTVMFDRHRPDGTVERRKIETLP